MNNYNNMWDFPIVHGVSFTDANRIHPLMQKRVDTLIDALVRDANVRKAVLFGSSLEFRCDSRSDIDLYVEKYDKEKNLEILPELDCEVDVITNLSPESRLYQEIERTGLLLFERN
ncbi:MAG: nucleotidyltransferase domain-containing protein [Clostridiales bacterium]|nr:nucleotidyltransferase domain-containing protein [Clostridiales bacterium]